MGTVGALALLLAAAPIGAQEVLVELDAGASIGRYTETGAGLEILPQPSFEVAVEVRVRETVSGYAAFRRSAFGCEEGLCAGRDVSITSQGIVAGARWTPALPWDQGTLWARAGVALMALDVDARGGTESFDMGPGFEAAVGLEFRIGQRLRVRPGFSYLWQGVSTDASDEHAATMAAHLGVAMPVFRF